VRAAQSRSAYREWLASRYVIREQRTWLRAVQHVQKAYPETSAWLLSCSSDEGGWGRWVPNSQGFPPGGWLQFYYSTWARMFGITHSGALQDLEARGFTLREPEQISSWYSPVGQALAGAWGVTHGRRGEWDGSGC
jgi:hypothetical protein